MADLGYLNMFARDVQKMASFYADLFQLEEIRESRSPIFRGLRTGKANLGFNAHDAYTLLNLQSSANDSGVKSFATFNVDACRRGRPVDAYRRRKGRSPSKSAVYDLLWLVSIGSPRPGRQCVPDQLWLRIVHVR